MIANGENVMPRRFSVFDSISLTARSSCAVAIVLAAIPIFAVIADEPRKSAVPQMGVYRGVNASEKVDVFGEWIGRSDLWAVDFIGWESWSNIGWPVWWLEHWSKWVHLKSGRKLVLAVPLLAGPVDGSGPTKGD